MHRSSLSRCLALIIVCSSFGLTGFAGADSPRFLVKQHGKWKYHAKTGAPPADWSLTKFDDTEWSSGKAGFGYGDDDDRTVLREMRGRFTSVYIRTSFHVESVDDVETLCLYISYDDGFIAYLNGKRVASAPCDPGRDPSSTTRGGRL